MLVTLTGALLLSVAQVQEPDWLDSFLEGSRALERGELVAAQSALERANRLLPQHAATAWQLAGANARAGDVSGAFTWLARAVERGGGEAVLLEWDPDLVSLREDARFRELLEKLVARDAHDSSEPFVAELAWHVGGYSLSASPRAEVVASGRGQNTFLIDRRARETLAVLDRPGDRITWVEISPEGRWVVTSGSNEAQSSREHFLRVFDATTGDLLRELDDVGWQAQIQFSADGARMLAVTPFGRDGAVWETESWTRLGKFPTGAEQTLLSPDGTRLLQLWRRGQERCDVLLWDVDEHGYVMEQRGHEMMPLANLDFSADGALALALENVGRSLHVYDARTGDEIRSIQPGEAPFTGARFLGASGELVTIDKSQALQVWNARDGDTLRTFHVSGERWHQLEASPHGGTVLVTEFAGPLQAFDALSGQLLWSYGQEPGGGVGGARFSPDGSRVLVHSFEGPPAVLDARSGAVLPLPPSPGLRTIVRAHPVRDELWVGASDGSLRRIDAASGRAIDGWRHGTAAIVGLSFPRDGARLAAIDREGVLRVVDTTDGALVATILDASPAGHGWLSPYASFAPDGSAVLVEGGTGALAVYEVNGPSGWNRRCMIEVGESRLDWTWRPDCQVVAVAAKSGRVLLFDARSGERLQPEMTIEGHVRALAFEPDGRRLWIGSDRSKVHVFDTGSGLLVHSLDLDDLNVFDSVKLGSITFRSDGQLAITASSGSGVVAAWEPGSGQRLWDYAYSGGNPSVLFSAFGASGERAYVWGQGAWSPRIVDAKNGRTLLDLGMWHFGALLPLPDEQLIGAVGPEGLEVLNSTTGARRWTRLELADGDWLLNAPTRHVDGTRAALEQVHLVLEQRSYPLDALAAALLDPKRVRAAAQGIPLAPALLPAIPELVWGTPSAPPSRVLHLSAGEEPPTVTLEATCPDGIAGFEFLVGGRHARMEGEADDATHRRLTLQLARPEQGESIDYRWRAIGSRGVLSRALHLTLERGR